MLRDLAATVRKGFRIASHTASQKGQAQHGGQKPLGRRARGRRKQRELGQGHDDKDRPAMIAWGSRHGAVGIQATTDCPVKTVQKAADRAVHAGRRLSTDVASSDRAVQGSGHEFVNQPPKASARGDVQDNRAACLFSWRKPSLRVCRGVSTCNLAGDVGFFQCLRHLRQHHACEKAKLILQAT
jgi:hypothetical protein